MPSFDEWFKRATGNDPFPYQRRFAEAEGIPQVMDVPTVPGKTAMVIPMNFPLIGAMSMA